MQKNYIRLRHHAKSHCKRVLFTELKNDNFTDELGHFCVLFAKNAHKHSSYDVGAKSKFFAIRIQKLIFGTNMVVISEEDEPPETKK